MGIHTYVCVMRIRACKDPGIIPILCFTYSRTWIQAQFFVHLPAYYCIVPTTLRADIRNAYVQLNISKDLSIHRTKLFKRKPTIIINQMCPFMRRTHRTTYRHEGEAIEADEGFDRNSPNRHEPVS